MRHPFHVPPTTRLTLVELERREVVSETLSFLAAGLIADSLIPAAGADTPARAARTSTAADPPATPVMPDLFAPSTAPAAAPERLPATPANHHAAAVGTADDSSDAFGPFGDPARPLRPAPTAPDGTPPHGGAGTPAPDARAERRPAPVSPSGAGTGSPVRTATPAGDVQVGPAAAAAPRPVTAAAPTTTAGAEPSSSAGGGAAMSSDEGDCDCCCQPPVFIRAVDPTAITWTVDAETGATTAAFLVYRGGSNWCEPLTVNYAISGDAVAGTDYQPLSGADYGTMTGTVTIPAGEFSTGILVQAVPSTAFFPRSLTLAVTAGDGYTVGDGVPATVTITHNYYGDIDGFPPDPDNPPQVGPQGAVDLDTAELPDGTTSTGGLLMWRDGRWPGDYSAINVAYAVDPSSTASSSDYESLSGVAAIPAGGWVGPVILQPTNDASLEGDETVNLDFPASHDWPYILDHDFTASFTIHDDEMNGPVAHDDGFAVSADQPTTIPASGVLCNDDAFSNFPLTAAAGTVTTDQGGTVDLFADGGFTYTPPAALAGGGTDTFSYTAVLADPAGARTATAVVTLTVVKVDLQMAGVDPMHKLDRGGYVPVNANDDSGSPITNEIPAERDFDTFLNADGVPFEDPDLVPIDIVVTPNVGLPGFFVLTSTNSGVGQIKLWIDDTRTNRAEGTYTQLNLPERVYVEGTEPGAALRESEVSLTYMFVTSCGVPIDAGADRVRVAVTPVVEELTVDASRSKVDFNGDPNNPNAQHTGQFGMILTNNPGPPDPEKPGAEFKAKVVWNGMPQGGSDLVFVQNFTDVVNGAPAGWVMTAQAIQQLQGQPGFKGQQNTIVLTGEPYPILDAPTKNDPVDYRYGFQGPTLNTDVNDVDHVSISAVDRPETGHPLWASGLDTINVTYQFRLYLLVRFSRGGTSVLYPIAYTNWQVVFHADMPGVDGNNNPLGPARIRGDSGAWPDQGFFRSHAVPELRRVDAQNRSRVGNEAIGPETNPPPQ